MIYQETPGFTAFEAQNIAREVFKVDGQITSLPSDRDQNFLIKTGRGEKFILKISNSSEDRHQLEAQNALMRHLAAQNIACSQVIKSEAGEWIPTIQSQEGSAHCVRLVTYLEGQPYGKIRRHSRELYANIGRFLGKMDRALTSFDHPAAHRDFHWDLAHGLDVVQQYSHLITDRTARTLVEKFAADFETNCAPKLPGLPQGVIHNDANDYNIIVSGSHPPENLENFYQRSQTVQGIIDFGDMVYSCQAADLAIAIAYAVLDTPDPLWVAAEIVKSYHAEKPLTEAEISVLFGMICLRLCVSASMAAYQSRRRPEDEYLVISQQPIRNTLPELAQIHPRFAEAVFRNACGFDPLPNNPQIIRWLRNHARTTPILGAELNPENCVAIDLGISSPLQGCDPSALAEPAVTRSIFKQLESAEVEFGVGGYDEARLLYTIPSFNTGGKLTNEHRTVHLGTDLFARSGTPVYAPLDGIVHAVQHNDSQYDYGPVILVAHETDAGLPFYTLYGHLSLESLPGLTVGEAVVRGQQIGAIGSPGVNGGWTPHLHFQIITDPLDLGCDFPGVCRASQRHIWTHFSPDPNLVLHLPDSVLPQKPPAKTATWEHRRRFIGPSLSLSYRSPLKIERGWMQYLYDETGRKYIDAYNNVPHVGHCHPRVVEAGCRQMGLLNTNTRYLHDLINQYAEKIISTLPPPLEVCFFVNSGSEANELALRLAQTFTRQKDMLVLEAAYHGNTTSLIAISPYKHAGPGGSGAPDWVHTAPIPDVYRGSYKKNDPQAAEKYARHIARIIDKQTANNTGIAGFIAETCPSVGGQIFPPGGYFKLAYAHIRTAGGVCIADEVQTGYGRTGTHFYAFEDHDVVPDILVLGKPIGNGHPLGVVVTTREIATAFDNGMEFFSTFGGNPVSCALGLAVFDIVQEENLQAHALEVGDHLLAGLRQFKGQYPIIGDIRGSGLFLGVELIRDHQTLEPAAASASFIANRMRDYGVLLGTDGPYHNVIKIRPPMPFSRHDADLLLDAMHQILEEDFSA